MDQTMAPGTDQSQILGDEAKRLMEFKSQNVRNKDQTSCPQCATLVSIQANKCPQCTSDISQHTQVVREVIQKLAEVTDELGRLHHQETELIQQQAGQMQLSKSLHQSFSETRYLQDMKVVLPFLIGLFAGVFFLKQNSSGLFFLLGSAAGAFAVYFLFNQWGLRKYVSLDLYRAVLFCGIVVILSSAQFDAANFWPQTSVADSGSGSVVVQSQTANIRQEPTTKSGVVTQAHSGEKLKVLGKQDSWYRVETESGSTGWIFANLVK